MLSSLTAVAVLAATLRSSAPQASPAASEWNQVGGGPNGSAVVDVEPIRGTPQVFWTYDESPLAGNPVCWGDVVFCVAQERRSRKLLALDLATGEELAAARLSGSKDGIGLATWLGTAVVATESALQTYSYKRGKLKREKRVKGSFGAPPAVYQGTALACDSEGLLHAIDLRSGKTRLQGYGRGTPAVLVDPEDPTDTPEIGALKVFHDKDNTPFLVVRSTFLGSPFEAADGFGTRTGISTLANDPDESRLDLAQLSAAATGLGDMNWFVRSPLPLLAPGSERFHAAITFGDGARLLPIDLPAAVVGKRIFGFDAGGRLIEMGFDGKGFELIPGDALPPGARPGPASFARGVLFFGNWAVEIEGRRVLWSLPELKTSRPLMPVADGRALVVDSNGALLCLADSAPGLAQPEHTRGTSRPGEGTGVILRSGVRIPGVLSEDASGEVLVQGAEGEAEGFPLAEIALIERDGETELVGPEFPVFQAAWRHLAAEHVTRLQELFQQYAKGRFVEEAKRILAEAEALDLAEAEVAALERKVAGISPNTAANAAKQRARIQRDEEKARGLSTREVFETAAWCATHDLPGAAGALISSGVRIAGDLKPFGDLPESLVPNAFPWRGARAAKQWLSWNKELLPAGAEFVARGEPDWGRAKGPLWSKDAILIRTQNLLFFSRETDPAIVGSCVRTGEGSLRALAQLLPPSTEEQAKERLDVRLHKTREDYLAEATRQNEFLEWSAGNYSPMEGISRFYVPRAGDSGQPTEVPDQPLGRDLFKVIAHDLTHHYIAERWTKTRRDSRQPGFWVVEGMARFVEDQFIELGRRGGGLDDTTVPSLDAVAQLAKRDSLLPMEQLVDGSQEDFLRLDKNPALQVRLQNTVVEYRLSMAHLYYEQAGSLVFFLLNHCGPDGRTKLLDYLSAHYRGRSRRKGWEALGFSSAADLDKKFRAFLGTL